MTERRRSRRGPVTRAGLPEWLEPMAATLTLDRFVDPAWTFERKLDGIRVLAYKDEGDVRLWSRNRLSLTDAYPAVTRALAALPVKTAIFDGEATGSWGRQGDADYHVFDLLWLNGTSLTAQPLTDRRAQLTEIPFRPPVARIAPLELVEGEWPWDRACREGWEGVIAKRLDSTYEHRRSKHWLKMKCEASQELVVGGFTDPQGGRVGLGALLVGYFDGTDFVYAGKVGTGFNVAMLLDLRVRLDRLELPRPPFTRGTGLPRLRARWARPEIVVQVAFTEWTVHGKLRHPRLVGIRTDKSAGEVVRERP
jgi:bifunctional non-homologous end joining protein LigD